MSSAPAPPPVTLRSRLRLLRSLVLPAACGALAIVIAAIAQHVLIGVFIAVGLALGTLNGLLAERAAARLVSAGGPAGGPPGGPAGGPTKGMVIGGSMRRLGAITLLALLIAVVARPDGWTVLLGLAFYQLLSVVATLGVAAREARQG